MDDCARHGKYSLATRGVPILQYALRRGGRDGKPEVLRDRYGFRRFWMRIAVPVLLVLLGVLCLASEAYAAGHVVINEFDQDPPGNTTILKDEWVELFNPTRETVDVGGWQLSTTHGEPVNVTIPEGTLIRPQGYLLIEPKRVWLDDVWEIVVLKDAAGNVVDRTLNATDPNHDGRSWQRFPNGQDADSDGDWRFDVATKGQSNGEEPVRPSDGSFGFMILAIGAGAGTACGGIAAAASLSRGPQVFAYGGYYYCGKDRVPLYSVSSWLWCPQERLYLLRLCRSCGNAVRHGDRFCDRCGRGIY